MSLPYKRIEIPKEDDQGLFPNTFRASVEGIREKVREKHLSGVPCTQADNRILHMKPVFWPDAALKALQKHFIEECRMTECVVGTRAQLVELFNDLLREE